MLLFLNRPDMSHGQFRSELSDDVLVEKLNALPATAAGKAASRNGSRATDISDWNAHVRQTLKQARLDSLIAYAEADDYTELEISSRVLFQSGETELTRAGEAVLEQLLPALNKSEGLIFIEGHTDDTPIQTERYPSNWELAAARATEVLKFFVAEGMDKSRFRAVSFGETQPLVPNDSEVSRQKNRRVNLVIHKHAA
jgi:chemotaxis protein MotB